MTRASHFLCLRLTNCFFLLFGDLIGFVVEIAKINNQLLILCVRTHVHLLRHTFTSLGVRPGTAHEKHFVEYDA